MEYVFNLFNEIDEFHFRINSHYDYFLEVNEILKTKIVNIRKSRYNKIHLYYELFSFIVYGLSSDQINEEILVEILTNERALAEFKNIENIQYKFKYDRSILLDEVKEILTKKSKVIFNYSIKKDQEKTIYNPSIEFNSNKELESFVKFLKNKKKIENQKEILYETTLINFTNIFEGFLQNIISSWYKTYPQLIIQNDKYFSYSDLIRYDSIEHLHDDIIVNTVRSFMNNNPSEKWISKLSKLSKQMNILENKIDKNLYDSFNEIFQKRNLIVHNNSRYDSYYVNKYPESKIEVDDHIDISFDNIKSIMEIFCNIGYIIGYYLWYEIDVENLNYKFDFFQDELGLNLIKDNKPNIAIKIYTLLNDNKKSFSRDKRLLLSINYALAMKNTGLNFEEILQQEDFSACDIDFKLALSALREDIGEIIKYFNDVVKKSSYEYVLDWPVLDPIKTNKEFIEFLSKEYDVKPKVFEEIHENIIKEETE